MLGKQVLSLIWDNEVALADQEIHATFAHLFTRILPVRHVTLVTTYSSDIPVAMSDGVELAAGIALGDVLAEELPLDLPYDSLVLFLPREARGTSHLLGGAVAESLLLTLTLCALPIERETDALYTLAQAATLRAGELAATDASIDMHAFCRGMADSLSRHWRVLRPGCAMAPSIFHQNDFLLSGQVLRFLPQLDPCFTLPDHSRINSNLLRVTDKPLGLEEWSDRIDCVLRAFLGAPARHVAPYQSRISSLFNFH